MVQFLVLFIVLFHHILQQYNINSDCMLIVSLTLKCFLWKEENGIRRVVRNNSQPTHQITVSLLQNITCIVQDWFFLQITLNVRVTSFPLQFYSFSIWFGTFCLSPWGVNFRWQQVLIASKDSLFVRKHHLIELKKNLLMLFFFSWLLPFS